MPSDDTESSGATNTSVWQMRAALVFVAAVWVLGCVWSFQEQTAFAESMGFLFPHLLPLVIDGLAAAMAGVAWAASLDARPAVPARLATLLAVVASSASNGVWAQERTHSQVAVVVAAGVPVAANLAFEVLLAELRRQVQRSRGLPPPVTIPHPRMVRVVLSPFRTFVEWRRMVLKLTAIEAPETVATTANRPAIEAGAEAGELAGESRVAKRANTRAKGRASKRGGRRAKPVDDERVAELIAQGLGRRRLASELDIKENQARQLLKAASNNHHHDDKIREGVPA